MTTYQVICHNNFQCQISPTGIWWKNENWDQESEEIIKVEINNQTNCLMQPALKVTNENWKNQLTMENWTRKLLWSGTDDRSNEVIWREKLSEELRFQNWRQLGALSSQTEKKLELKIYNAGELTAEDGLAETEVKFDLDFKFEFEQCKGAAESENRTENQNQTTELVRVDEALAVERVVGDNNDKQNEGENEKVVVYLKATGETVVEKSGKKAVGGERTEIREEEKNLNTTMSVHQPAGNEEIICQNNFSWLWWWLVIFALLGVIIWQWWKYHQKGGESEEN